MLKRQELQEKERKLIEDLKISGEWTEVVKNVVQALREGG
jgi:hypothetical protein